MKCNFSLFVLLIILVAGCQSKQEAPSIKEIKVPVRVAKPICKDITEYVDVLGTLQASRLVDVRPQVDGQLLQIFVQEGEWVEKGQKLFLIDPKPYILKVCEAKAELVKEESSLLAAQKKLDRFESLAHKELIAKNEWDELENDVKKAQAQVALCKAKLKACKLTFERCKITSSFYGRVGKISIHEGQLVSNMQEAPLVQIAALDPLLCEFCLTEKEFARLSGKNTSIDVHPLSFPEQAAQGTLSFIDNHFDASSGQIVLRAKIENKNTLFRPGQVVRVRVPVGTKTGAFLIPQKAVKFTQAGATVFVVGKDSVCTEHPVQVGDEYDGFVVVLKGLMSNASVIVEGNQSLYAGAKVEVKP